MKPSISRRTRWAAALFAGSLILVGCGGGGGSSSSPGDNGSSGELTKEQIFSTGLVNVPEEPSDATEGGTLVVADFGEPRTLDAAKTYANGATGGNALAAVYDTLMRYDFTNNTWEPQLAESFTSDDNVTWTLKLRDGVKFTDGTPLNADAVLGSQAYYAANYAYQSLLMMANVAEANKIDDLTIEYVTRNPWATFPNMMSQGPGMIMAPAAYKDPDNFDPIGAGPFKLNKYSPGEELLLDANEDYWNGKPKLDQLKFIWIGQVDDQPKIEAINDGSADAAFLRKADVVESARKDGHTGMMWGTGLASNYWFNVREGRPGADPRVRQAVLYAFDPVSFRDRTHGGAGIATKALMAESSPWYAGVPEPEVDLDKAKELLDEAKADGYDGKIKYSHGADPDSQDQAVALKAILESVGFEVELEALRSVADQTQQMYVDHTFDLAVSASTIADVDPYAALTSVLGGQSPSNPSGYDNPELDALLVELQGAESPEAGKETMKKIEELWYKDAPGIGISAGGTFEIWSTKVHGIKPTTETMVLFDQAWKE